jgi:4-hydroxy-tetrahydrodipicolinate synthase
MTEALFTGVGVALVTLFNDDGTLDAKATANLAGTLVECGIQSIVVAGTTGEAAALPLEDRIALLEAVREVVPMGSVPVIAGTGAPSTRDARTFTAAARDGGADGILALSLPGNADLPAYYTALAAAAGEVPLLAYNYPAASAPGIPIAVLRGLPVVGVKDSSGDPDRLLETRATWDQPIYTGSAALLSLAGPIGCAGAILALANSEPEDCIAAFDGDAGAQLRLALPNREARARFPGAIKAMTAARFSTSAVCRMG